MPSEVLNPPLAVRLAMGGAEMWLRSAMGMVRKPVPTWNVLFSTSASVIVVDRDEKDVVR